VVVVEALKQEALVLAVPVVVVMLESLHKMVLMDLVVAVVVVELHHLDNLVRRVVPVL
jgi:hypothetical protein